MQIEFPQLYIFPKEGDVVKEGDEYLNIKGICWEKITNFNGTIGAFDVGFIRRPLKTTSPKESPPKIEGDLIK